MRGEINFPARARQINNFSGLLFGKITPTDVDGEIEYHDKAWVRIEVKYRGKELPFGQKLCIERFVSDVHKSGKSALAIVVEHEVDDPNQSVPVADCYVRDVYCSTQKLWVKPKIRTTAKEMITSFFAAVDGKIKVGEKTE
ncbi:hypothetical protein FACS1894105_02570 [Clostridia bacterium]|nr:hypothetical protein FACS1894105_02570 [Clostridia bacterium]